MLNNICLIWMLTFRDKRNYKLPLFICVWSFQYLHCYYHHHYSLIVLNSFLTCKCNSTLASFCQILRQKLVLFLEDIEYICTPGHLYPLVALFGKLFLQVDVHIPSSLSSSRSFFTQITFSVSPSLPTLLEVVIPNSTQHSLTSFSIDSPLYQLSSSSKQHFNYLPL